ncbi:MAG: DUF4058 family protein [Caldilineaceae bacterium]
MNKRSVICFLLNLLYYSEAESAFDGGNMAYRFPGMDPYLEDPAIWRGFHHRLADAIADGLNPSIGPKYYADIEIHTTYEEVYVGKAKPIIPDVAIVVRPVSMGGAEMAPIAMAEPAEVMTPVRRAVTSTPVTLRTPMCCSI